jgi:hypothetical protein
MKYRTNIEVISNAANKDEAMEIVDDYLAGNITSGIDMKYATKPVRFYNNSAVKMIVVGLLVTIGFFSGVKAKPQYDFAVNMCRMAAVTPPLKTSGVNSLDARFKKEWENKRTAEVINFIKK